MPQSLDLQEEEFSPEAAARTAADRKTWSQRRHIDSNGTAIAKGRARTVMKLFAISNRGLAVIGALVVVLWSLILAERAVIRQVHDEHYQFMQSRPQSFPVQMPQPTAHPVPRLPQIPAEELSQTGMQPAGRV
ncbi:MAG: hypothetical protein O2968_22715 [Acidobacteria bacterium]|nr:hypothetical protein [Acidobacteriota bacterium]